MKNFIKSFLFALSIFALANNQAYANIDSTILQAVKTISADDLTNIEKNELQERTGVLKKMVVQTGNAEEQAIIKEKIALLDQVMYEKYPTLWKKVKRFVKNHKLAVSASSIIIVAAVVVSIILIKKHNNQRTEEDPNTDSQDPNTDSQEPNTDSQEPKTELFNRLKTRVRNVLIRNGVTTDEQVKGSKEQELMDIKGFGKASWLNVLEVFRKNIDREEEDSQSDLESTV